MGGSALVSPSIYSFRRIGITGMNPPEHLVSLAVRVKLLDLVRQIYVQLFDNPSLAKGVLSTGKEPAFDSVGTTMSCLTGLSAEEEKKAKKKARKAQQKLEELKKGKTFTVNWQSF
jgi:hypothetical protein